MVSSSKSVSFQYDHNGLRTRKAVTEGNATTVTDYILHGKLVMHMTVSKTVGGVTTQNSLHFFYDAQSRPAKVSYNGTMYTYLHNLQGDIVGILDSSDALVVEYKYDAWGRALSTVCSLTTDLAEENPFRYRGYVYDEETGLYYLRSRYYNPTWCRFVNADGAVVDAQTNLFVYTKNNPVRYADNTGLYPESCDVVIYLDEDGDHWAISIHTVCISFDNNGIMLFNLTDPDDPIVKTYIQEYKHLTIRDVPRKVAYRGMAFVLKKVNLYNGDMETIDMEGVQNGIKDWGFNDYRQPDIPYDFVSNPCAKLVVDTLKEMGIYIERIWGSPLSKDYDDYCPERKSEYMPAKDFFRLNTAWIKLYDSISYKVIINT